MGRFLLFFVHPTLPFPTVGMCSIGIEKRKKLDVQNLPSSVVDQMWLLGYFGKAPRLFGSHWAPGLSGRPGFLGCPTFAAWPRGLPSYFAVAAPGLSNSNISVWSMGWFVTAVAHGLLRRPCLAHCGPSNIFTTIIAIIGPPKLYHCRGRQEKDVILFLREFNSLCHVFFFTHFRFFCKCWEFPKFAGKSA